MKRLFFIGITLLLILFVFFTDFFIPKDFIKLPFRFLSGGLTSGLLKENQALKLEKEILKAQIQQMQQYFSPGGSLKLALPVQKNNLLSVRVFSTYPFNVKNVLSLATGAKGGLKKDMAGTIGGEILVGQISEIFENSANLKTIFDSGWQLPVKIGADKINGLFQGGNEPRVTLVEKPVKVGDAVFSAGAGVPLDLKIGEISEIKEEKGGIFKEALVRAPYNINDLDAVDIME